MEDRSRNNDPAGLCFKTLRGRELMKIDEDCNMDYCASLIPIAKFDRY